MKNNQLFEKALATPVPRGWLVAITIFIALLGIFTTWSTLAITPPAKQQVAESIRYIPTMLNSLPRNFQSLGVPLVFALSSWWFGRRLLGLARLNVDGTKTTFGVSLALGFFFWLMLSQIIGAIGILNNLLLWLLTGTATVLAVIEISRACSRRWTSRKMALLKPDVATIIVCGLAFFSLWVALLSSLEPEVQYDGRFYHLAKALRFAQHHRIYDLVRSEHFLAAGFADYQETFYAAAIVMGGIMAAKATAGSIGVLAYIVLVLLVADTWKLPLAGPFTGLIFVGTPIVTWAMTTESTDLPLVPYASLAFWSLWRWTVSKRLRWLTLAGALSGGMFGIKGTSGVVILIVLGMIAYLTFTKSRSLEQPRRIRWFALSIGAYIVPAVLTAGPWLIQAYIFTHDPLFPIAMSHFHTPFSSKSVYDELTYDSTLWSHLYWWNCFLGPFYYTFQVDKYEDIIGPATLVGISVVPLGLLLGLRDNRKYLGLLSIAASGLFIFSLFGLNPARYITWDLAAFAALAGIATAKVTQTRALGSIRLLVPAVITLASLVGNQILVPFQLHATSRAVLGEAYLNWSYIYGSFPEEDVQLIYVPMIRYINNHLTARAKVFDAADLFVFNSYSLVELFRGDGGDSPVGEGQWRLDSPDALSHLRREGVTHVVVFGDALRSLRKSVLWAHLREIHREPASLLYSAMPQHDYSTVLFVITEGSVLRTGMHLRRQLRVYRACGSSKATTVG